MVSAGRGQHSRDVLVGVHGAAQGSSVTALDIHRCHREMLRDVVWHLCENLNTNVLASKQLMKDRTTVL